MRIFCPAVCLLAWAPAASRASEYTRHRFRPASEAILLFLFFPLSFIICSAFILDAVPAKCVLLESIGKILNAALDETRFLYLYIITKVHMCVSRVYIILMNSNLFAAYKLKFLRSGNMRIRIARARRLLLFSKDYTRYISIQESERV